MKTSLQLPIIVKRLFRVIAHRSASAYAPENIRAAFKLAIEMGVKDIELDVQLPADGEVVICHDLSLERYGSLRHYRSDKLGAVIPARHGFLVLALSVSWRKTKNC